MCADRRGTFKECLCGSKRQLYGIESGRRMSLEGRPLPTADVSYPIAQLDGQLSGCEIAGPTDAGRPTPDTWVARLAAAKQSLM